VVSAKKALTEDGFLFVTGTGVTDETLRRNLAITQLAINGLSREEKEPYAAELDKGSYKGYKLKGIWTRDGGIPDNIEVCYIQNSELFADFRQALQPRIFLVYRPRFTTPSKTLTVHTRDPSLCRTHLQICSLPNPKARVARSGAPRRLPLGITRA
jgi:hypothetical protein